MTGEESVPWALKFMLPEFCTRAHMYLLPVPALLCALLLTSLVPVPLQVTVLAPSSPGDYR